MHLFLNGGGAGADTAAALAAFSRVMHALSTQPSSTSAPFSQPPWRRASATLR